MLKRPAATQGLCAQLLMLLKLLFDWLCNSECFTTHVFEWFAFFCGGNVSQTNNKPLFKDAVFGHFMTLGALSVQAWERSKLLKVLGWFRLGLANF